MVVLNIAEEEIVSKGILSEADTKVMATIWRIDALINTEREHGFCVNVSLDWNEPAVSVWPKISFWRPLKYMSFLAESFRRRHDLEFIIRTYLPGPFDSRFWYKNHEPEKNHSSAKQVNPDRDHARKQDLEPYFVKAMEEIDERNLLGMSA